MLETHEAGGAGVGDRAVGGIKLSKCVNLPISLKPSLPTFTVYLMNNSVISPLVLVSTRRAMDFIAQ